MSDILYVDNTILSCVAKCDTKALVRHVWERTTEGESAALMAGRAVHKVLETWAKHGSHDECLQALNDYIMWGEEKLSEKHRLHPLNVLNIMNLWLEQHPVELFPLEILPNMVEINFKVPLDKSGKIVYTGVMDLVCRDRRTNGLFNLDWKTTASMSNLSARNFEMRSQMPGYAWALQQMTGEPVIGTYIGLIELSKMPEIVYNKNGTARKCRTHAVPIDKCWAEHMNSKLLAVGITQPQIEQWKRDACRLAIKYNVLYQAWKDAKQPILDHVSMNGTFNGSCDWCQFKDWCAMGRKQEHLEMMTVLEPWKPWEVEDGN